MKQLHFTVLLMLPALIAGAESKKTPSVSACVFIEDIGVELPAPDELNLYPYLVKMSLRKYLGGLPDEGLAKAISSGFRIHSPSRTFGLSEQEIKGRTFMATFIPSGGNWVLAGATDEPMQCPSRP